MDQRRTQGDLQFSITGNRAYVDRHLPNGKRRIGMGRSSDCYARKSGPEETVNKTYLFHSQGREEGVVENEEWYEEEGKPKQMFHRSRELN